MPKAIDLYIYQKKPKQTHQERKKQTNKPQPTKKTLGWSRGGGKPEMKQMCSTSVQVAVNSHRFCWDFPVLGTVFPEEYRLTEFSLPC